MIAIKEFRYHDFRTGKSVDVQVGEALDMATLRRNKVDVEKLARTKFVERGEGTTAPKKRRVRGS